MDINELLDKLKKVQNEIRTLEETESIIRDAILEEMREMAENGEPTFSNGVAKVTYSYPTTKKGVDSKLLQASYPDIYNEVMKTSEVKEQVKITFNKEEL